MSLQYLILHIHQLFQVLYSPLSHCSVQVTIHSIPASIIPTPPQICPPTQYGAPIDTKCYPWISRLLDLTTDR